ncbi:MAG TPA: CHC2 zinc finger domain-containing protein [bacterium]|nr:CHC2 zinc finger domain-containing protein [bacterium]
MQTKHNSQFETFDINDAKTYLKDIRKLYRATLKKTQRLTKNINRLQTDDFSKWFYLETVKYIVAWDLPYLKKQIYKMERLINPPKAPSNFIMALDRARRVPIMEVAQSVLQGIKRSGNSYKALCPFHKEKTPSFTLYPEANSYYCFGCGVHGDTIDLIRNLNNCDFKQAVAYLSI